MNGIGKSWGLEKKQTSIQHIVLTLILLSNLQPKIYNNSYKGKTVLIFLTYTAKYKGKVERESSTLTLNVKV